MTEIILGSCEPRSLLSHMALYGLGAILEAGGARDVRLGWTKSANSRPFASVQDLSDIAVAELVREHARTLTVEGSWLHASFLQKTAKDEKLRGLMSPRLSRFDEETWPRVQQLRHEVLDALTDGHQWLDLRFLAALGEPSYWSFNRKGDSLQDDGASRLEMQPRNQGAEFVGTRLRKLAAAVSARDPMTILSGIQGDSVVDEAGNGSADSRTATGLAGLGPTDNALAWCALWGISQFPIAMRVNSSADTSGHLSHRRDEWFYMPLWKGEWRPAGLRTILASQFPRVLAARGLSLEKYTDADVATAGAWLASRGVEGVFRFPVHVFGSDNAPERRAMRGEPIPVRGAA
jgi:CRISPR-associated protein Csb3